MLVFRLRPHLLVIRVQRSTFVSSKTFSRSKTFNLSYRQCSTDGSFHSCRYKIHRYLSTRESSLGSPETCPQARFIRRQHQPICFDWSASLHFASVIESYRCLDHQGLLIRWEPFPRKLASEFTNMTFFATTAHLMLPLPNPGFFDRVPRGPSPG